MAEGPPAEAAGRRPAVDFQVGYGEFYVRIKIDNPWLAAGIIGAGVVTLATLYRRNPESVETAVRSALRGFADRVLSIRPSSVLVDVCFHTKERFLAFMDAIATGTVKQKLQERFSELGLNVELELTVTVYESASQMGKETPKKEKATQEVSGSSRLPASLAGITSPVVPGKGVLNVTLLASEWPSSEKVWPSIIKELALQLAHHMQVEVTVLVPKNACSEEGRRFAEEHNIAVREAVVRPGYDRLDWLSFPPRDLAIDVVLGHGPKLCKQAQIIRESHSCKWVQVVDKEPEELGIYKNYLKAISKGAGKNRTEEDLYKLANLVVAVGPKIKEVYSAFLRSALVDVIQLTPGIFSEFSVIEQATIESERFKVLTFGRGDPEDFSLKGFDIAAEAIAELNDSSYRLIFVGAPDGKQEEVAENLLKCGISRAQLKVSKFVQSNERLKELFCEVDLVIMPSKVEGFGLLALKALSAGLPILVSEDSGIGDALLCLPFGTQFVVESPDPKEWAKAIRAVRLKARSVRLEEIQRLRASYEATFSWEKQCDTLVHLFKECGE